MKPTPQITNTAKEQAEMAKQTLALLRADLQGLNVALTTGGNGTLAERLAHMALLDILNKLQPAADAIRNLADELNS